MARIRTIKPEFWQDEKLAPCDPLTRLVFLGLISAADDLGRVLDNERVLNAFIFPETEDSVREPLATLSRMGRILRGKTASGQRIIQIVNWERHQKVDKPQHKMAFPEIVAIEEVTPIRESFANDSRMDPESVASRSPVPEASGRSAETTETAAAGRVGSVREMESVDTEGVTGVRESFANHSRMDRDPLAPHTYDLRPTTYDHRPTSELADASSAGPVAQGVDAGKPAGKTGKYPDWPEALRREQHAAWTARIGPVGYGQWVGALGPLLGGAVLGGADPALRAAVYGSYLAAVEAHNAKRYASPSHAARLLPDVLVAHQTHPHDPVARLAAVDRLFTRGAAAA